jgi:hypothetical protein
VAAIAVELVQPVDEGEQRAHRADRAVGGGRLDEGDAVGEAIRAGHVGEHLVRCIDAGLAVQQCHSVGHGNSSPRRSSGEHHDGWWLVGPAKPERSVVLASRGPGAIADIVILSVAGWLSGIASPLTMRVHRPLPTLLPVFDVRRTKRRRRLRLSRCSVERTRHCCRNACTLVEGPCRDQFASRSEH